MRACDLLTKLHLLVRFQEAAAALDLELHHLPDWGSLEEEGFEIEMNLVEEVEVSP